MSTITTTRPPLSSSLTSALKSLSVPLSDQDPCDGCAAADVDHEEEEGLDYGKGFEIDLESQMLGTVKEYGSECELSLSGFVVWRWRCEGFRWLSPVNGRFEAEPYGEAVLLS